MPSEQMTLLFQTIIFRCSRSSLFVACPAHRRQLGVVGATERLAEGLLEVVVGVTHSVFVGIDELLPQARPVVDQQARHAAGWTKTRLDPLRRDIRERLAGDGAHTGHHYKLMAVI